MRRRAARVLYGNADDVARQPREALLVEIRVDVLLLELLLQRVEVQRLRLPRRPVGGRPRRCRLASSDHRPSSTPRTRSRRSGAWPARRSRPSSNGFLEGRDLLHEAHAVVDLRGINDAPRRRRRDATASTRRRRRRGGRRHRRDGRVDVHSRRREDAIMASAGSALTR